MKKLFALALSCFMFTIQADQLSDAIRAVNVEEVRLLLAGQKFTKQQIDKYLDTAQNIIQIYTPSADFVPLQIQDREARLQSLTRSIMMGNVSILLHALMLGITPRFRAFFSFSIIVDIIGVTLYVKERNSIKKNTLYNDAVTIKEMLYDCMENATK